MKSAKATEKSERKRKKREKERLKEKHPLETHVRRALCTRVCGGGPMSPVPVLVLAGVVQFGLVPVLYQGVGLGVGVVALFQVSSGVQQRLLGGAEFGSLCLGQVS